MATELGWHLLDSGALYRLTGLAAARQGISVEQLERLAELAGGMQIRFAADASGNELIYLDGAEVSAAIRTEKAGERASEVAAIPAVREALLQKQRDFRRAPGLVADGRDMGTRIFPDAALKIFLTASAEERARRRHKQLSDKGINVNLAALAKDIRARDERDSTRAVSPLLPAPDAIELDSTDLSIDAVTQAVLDRAREIWK